MKLPVTIDDVKRAYAVVRSVLPVTPLTSSPGFSQLSGLDVKIKWDIKFESGAFKERGACNFLANLSKAEAKAGICAASMGNHALGLSLHAKRLSIPCTIVMPRSAALVKVKRTQEAGATVLVEGETFSDSVQVAKKLAQSKKLTYVPPYDHEDIIAGQGTCGLEILEQLKGVSPSEICDSIVVPIGGGGYISGIAVALKALRPEIKIIGVQSEWAYRSMGTTIAGGIAVKHIGVKNKKIIDTLVDKVVTVSEEQIADAIIKTLSVEKTVVEGAGAAGVAALLSGLLPSECKKPVICVCGSNIDLNLLCVLIERDLVNKKLWMRLTLAIPDKPGALSHVTSIIAERSGNVLDIHHDRFSPTLGLVNVHFLLEVRDAAHGESLKDALKKEGVDVSQSNQSIL